MLIYLDDEIKIIECLITILGLINFVKQNTGIKNKNKTGDVQCICKINYM